jgi:sialate O-acetylesterase
MRYRIHIDFLLISILTGMSIFGFSQHSDQKIRVACIGDSVTKGFGLEKPVSQSYPAQLQALLGSTDQVENFGGLKLAPVFMNHMVLQQKSKIHVWGKAGSGSEIVGKFNQQVEKCVVNESGEWDLNFNPVPAGGPYTLRVTAGNQQEILLNDILVGELWICAGQSNMEFQLKDASNVASDISKASNTNIRLFNWKGIVRPDDTKWDSLSLDKINKLEFLEGKWKTCNPENAADFSAIGYYFGKMLNEDLKVPVGLIQVTVGGAPIEAFIDRKTLEIDPYLVDVLCKWKQNDLIMDWCQERAKLNISLSKNEYQRHPFEPAYIYEAGIQALAGLNVSGVILYQGESNAHNAEHYKNAFPAFVKSWRSAFNNPEMPFYFAQLSSLNRPSWPHFRNIQRELSLSVPNTAMVVTSDLGDSLNVHPKRKREVGVRFAKLALAKVYGQKEEYSGPEVLGFNQTGEMIRIHFNHASQLKTSDGIALREFEIAGRDEIFKPVNAILNGEEIIIQTKMKNVQKVRYGWNPFSRGNLINEAGLPASTFAIEIN